MLLNTVHILGTQLLFHLYQILGKSAQTNLKKLKKICFIFGLSFITQKNYSKVNPFIIRTIFNVQHFSYYLIFHFMIMAQVAQSFTLLCLNQQSLNHRQFIWVDKASFKSFTKKLNGVVFEMLSTLKLNWNDMTLIWGEYTQATFTQ